MGLCLTKPADQQIRGQLSAVKCSASEADATLIEACCTDVPGACTNTAIGTGVCASGAQQQACVQTASLAHGSPESSLFHGDGAKCIVTSADEGLCTARASSLGSQAASTAVGDDAQPQQFAASTFTASAAEKADEKADVVPSVEGDTSAAGPRSRSSSAKSTAFENSAVLDTRQQANGSASRSVKFANLGPLPGGQLPPLAGRPRSTKNGLPRRSRSFAAPGSGHGDDGQLDVQLPEAVLARQVELLRSNRMGKLKQRRGGLDSSFQALQDALEQSEKPLGHVNTRAAGLKHIGFGPFKRENQDEFFIQVGEFGGQPSSNLFCVFDGHGSHGKDAALYSRQILPRLLDVELAKYFQRINADSEEGLKGAVEMLITEVFGDTERSVVKSGVNLASSGTTASVAYQKGNRLWVASAGDSRAILCSRNMREQCRALPLTLDHRPRRTSERERIEAAGARVAPKRLPSGRSVGEPRMWLQNAHGPGLLLSRSLGDLTAATVGCTSDPEVSYTTLRPGVDHVLVMATDGVWDVLTNEQVCDIVVESPDPHIACRRVLDAALYEWEERMSADNITVLVVEFDWGEDGSLSLTSMEQISTGTNLARWVRQGVAKPGCLHYWGHARS
eukprot:GHUV01042020.1.p1 GENE.GHUV01042020.1~~GHUV01042020.1.p1  ORF type:complete len:620 (+),score=147.71 GHUV01042020.1:226-2085(+)